MIKKFIQERQLEKVIVHPTLIPKVHRVALERGQIRIKERVDGMRIYEATEKADVHVNYFMTGTKFYEIENRLKMLNTMIHDEKLNEVVEVWNLENEYNQSSFYGVIAAIKNKFPGRRIHGMHGSDVGGMLVRAIYDESFGIIPYAIRRTDSVSATAIRSGAKGMTTEGVSQIMNELKCAFNNKIEEERYEAINFSG